MEQRKVETIKRGFNDTTRKCIRISIPKAVFDVGEYLELDYDAYNQAKREFPEVQFLDPLKREIEEKGEYVELLYPYK